MRTSVGLTILGLFLVIAESCSAQGPSGGNDSDDSNDNGGGTGGVAGAGIGGSVGGTAGGAMCLNGQTSCNGTCTTLATDFRHCGMCNHVCANGQTCSASQCTCTAGLQ